MLNQVISRAAAAAQQGANARAFAAAEQRTEARAYRCRRTNRQQHIARRMAASNIIVTRAGNAAVTIRAAVITRPVVRTPIPRPVIRAAVVSRAIGNGSAV